MQSAIQRACLIGNHTPRQCGIATFTADVANSLIFNGIPTDVVAMNDRAKGYEYPPIVKYQIPEKRVGSYRAAADYLNLNDYSVVCLQHEYGIFGGSAGRHVLNLLRNLQMPLVTTLHTLLEEPDSEQHQVLQEIVQLSQRVVVMSERAHRMLQAQFKVDPSRIDLIPHGTPDTSLVDPDTVKPQLGLEGKQVLLTFGLLSPDKGLEYVIQSLPKLVERHPNLMYVILGATHPQVRAQTGDAYRKSLKAMVGDLGLQDHVRFDDRYVSLEELVRYLQGSDIYITPYLKPQQITSGTLAYAFACGKPIISTPYWHAEELLSQGNGVLVPFRDAEATGNAIQELLEHPENRQRMANRAYAHSRPMTWPNVGQRYIESFERAVEESRSPLRVSQNFAQRYEINLEVPRLDLRHLCAISDDTGILQHCVGPIPNRHEGYCVDDNARALLVASRLKRIGVVHASLDNMAASYLAFLYHSFSPHSGRFRNFMDYGRNWMEEIGSEDSHGRSIWGLGEWVAGPGSSQMRGVAFGVLEKALPAVEKFTSPRAWAYTIIGLSQNDSPLAGESFARQLMHELADRLKRLYKRNSTAGWRWFEEYATYDNARLSQAMLVAGETFDDMDYVDIGLESLDWLCEQQTGMKGCFSPIGCQRVWNRGQEKPQFDQQPLEAWGVVDACLAAATHHKATDWMLRAKWAMDWFTGENDCQLPIVDFQTGGCRDGLHSDSVNENQGAESTLAYLGTVSEYLRFVQETNWKLSGVNQ